MAARGAAGVAATLRVGIIDSSYDSMPQILHEVQARYPGLVIHQVEASVPGQYQQLIDGRLDVGVGRAAARAWRRSRRCCSGRTRSGCWCPAGHRFAGLEAVPVADLAAEPLLLAEEAAGAGIQPVHDRAALGRPASLPPCTGGRWRASGRPPISSPRGAACTACLRPASRRSPGPPAAADRAGRFDLVPVVGPVARGRRLRPRTRRRQLRPGDVQAARLAHHRHRRPGGTVSNRTRPHHRGRQEALPQLTAFSCRRSQP